MFLSPGPSTQNYFEHAYLARYLGFSVVEGSDLTVRDDRVYLKTVEGLKPVDLIMRRISAELCDPLELRTDSLVGVPGLLQAARAGKVTIGNALGSGLVESDSFLSFLPSLSRLLPGRGPRDAERRDLVVRPRARARATCSSTSTSSSCGASRTSRNLFTRGQGRLITPDITADERARLIREIERSGHDFVGQEPAALSMAPDLVERELAARRRRSRCASTSRRRRTATKSCRAV